MKVNIAAGAGGPSSPIRYFMLEHPTELAGAFRVRADDSLQAMQDNEKAMPTPIFDLAYQLVENGPALSIIVSEQAGTICFAICHRDQNGWTKEVEDGIKTQIEEVFSSL